MLLTLEKVELEAPLAGNGSVMVMAELVLPRPAIALRRALLEVSLRKGKRSLVKDSFLEKALLKERVDGSFGLKVAVTRPSPPNQFADLLRGILASGIQNAGDILSRMYYTTPPARRLAMGPTDAIAGALNDTGPEYLADGSLDLSSGTLTNGLLTVPIKLNRNLRDSDPPAGPRNRPRTNAAASHVFRKGHAVGQIVLRVEL